MNGTRALLLGSAVFIGLTIVAIGGQQAQPAGGGVFTAAQAQAGQAAYAQQCAGCHGAGFSRIRRRSSARGRGLPRQVGTARDQRALHVSRPDDAADQSGRAGRGGHARRHRVSAADQRRARRARRR